VAISYIVRLKKRCSDQIRLIVGCSQSRSESNEERKKGSKRCLVRFGALGSLRSLKVKPVRSSLDVEAHVFGRLESPLDDSAFLLWRGRRVCRITGVLKGIKDNVCARGGVGWDRRLASGTV
jgi:hypothetical protein